MAGQFANVSKALTREAYYRDEKQSPPPPARGHRSPLEALLAEVRVDGEWRQRAACKGKTDVMFPAKKEGILAALAVCAKCPVVAPCREYALANESARPLGIWGGMSGKEQRRRRGVRV